jgi:glutaredoxin 3
MAQITIYTSMICPYCSRAKRLLKEKGVQFDEIDVTMSAKKRAEMTEMAGGRTSVPQIFVDGRHIGDCDGIHALDAEGKLDPLLGL